ncbi:hypothetical protein MC885_012478 [Smutsia gigantea]|nr:hypothetical protein MC885_012478 [Smutsia gigantea]
MATATVVLPVEWIKNWEKSGRGEFVEPGPPSARRPRRANRPGLPLLSALRRREARAVAKSPAWHLLSCRGAVSRTVPASRGAAAVGEV